MVLVSTNYFREYFQYFEICTEILCYLYLNTLYLFSIWYENETYLRVPIVTVYMYLYFIYLEKRT